MEEGYDHAGGGGSPPQQQLQQQLLMVDSALLDQGGEVEPSQVRESEARAQAHMQCVHAAGGRTCLSARC